MRSEVGEKDIEELIECFSEVISNLERCRELIADSGIKTALVHVDTFRSFGKRLVTSSNRVAIEVESQVDSFKLGQESGNKKAIRRYAKYYQKDHAPRKRQTGSESQ